MLLFTDLVIIIEDCTGRNPVRRSTMESLNSSLVTQSLNFHGSQLQKFWEAEHGDSNLIKNDVKDLNFQVYGQRQKYLTFQDRGKRLKLHQFIAKKGDLLFSKDATEQKPLPEEGVVTEDMFAIMPPFETFLNVDKQRRLKYFFEVSGQVIGPYE